MNVFALVQGCFFACGLFIPSLITSTPPPPLPSSLAAANAAINAAQTGQLDDAHATGLHDNLLYVWIEYAILQHSLTALDAAQAERFLLAHANEPAGTLFRTIWLKELARRQAWQLFIANWSPQNDPSLQCTYFWAEKALGHSDSHWIHAVTSFWLENVKPLPSPCDAVFTALQAHQGVSAQLRWQRIERAANAQQPETMRATANGLPPAARTLALSYADFIQTHAQDTWQQWPKTARSRAIATAGLIGWARQDPDGAEHALAIVAPALTLDAAARQRVLYSIAYWSAASYLPQSAQRFAAVSEPNYDDKLRILRVREALARSDWSAALTAINKMTQVQHADERWQYFHARLLDKTGHSDQAKTLYANIASNTSYYGFLAADQTHQPYVVCPTPAIAHPSPITPSQKQWLDRALALFQLGRQTWADLEWDKMTEEGLNAGQRQSVAKIAQQYGWYDRAIRTLRQPSDQHLYALRFPLAYQEEVVRHTAAYPFDPAWILAEIRAESTFDSRARSGANARGLLQLLPSTASQLAAQKGITSYKDAESLYDPSVNLTLGTAYLASLLNTYKLPYIAIAAYNAGPSAVQRWTAQRKDQDADFWIETISYQETREYVARVLAFSVIYDWRLHHSGLRISARLDGRWNTPRHAYVCPPAGLARAPMTGERY